jgi:hypothetical protein
MTVSLNKGYGHDVNIAFFKIEQKETFVEINASFSFTLRNALLKFSPSLKNATTKQAYKDAFFKYVKANLILLDVNGQKMEFESFKELLDAEHSGQDNIKLIFRGSNIARIRNTLIFNVSPKQVNYHTVVSKTKEDQVFTTNTNNMSFYLKTETFNNYSYLIYVPVTILLIFVILFFLYNLNRFQKKHNNDNL